MVTIINIFFESLSIPYSFPGAKEEEEGMFLFLFLGKLFLVAFDKFSTYTSEEFENGVLFLRLGLLSTLVRHENGAF